MSIFSEKLADDTAAKLGKGVEAYIEGRLQVGHWQGQDFLRRVITKHASGGLIALHDAPCKRGAKDARQVALKQEAIAFLRLANGPFRALSLGDHCSQAKTRQS